MNQSRETDYEVKLLVNPVNILTSFVTVIMNKIFLIIIMNVIKKTKNHHYDLCFRAILKNVKRGE